MTYTRQNKGVCSRSTTVEIRGGIIQGIHVQDGCDGNLKAVCALLLGMPAAEAVGRLQHITCDERATSCPAQIAQCIEEALRQAQQEVASQSAADF